jgi:cob(I)alamin adenosyltransferase
MKNSIKHGMVHAYFGDGKGKTSAALGLALRAAGHGLNSKMIQFMKNGKSGEIFAIKNIAEINIESFGLDEFYIQGKSDVLKHREYCAKGMVHANNFDCDVLILDEIFGAISNQLITIEETIALIQTKPHHVELVLTGRELPLK